MPEIPLSAGSKLELHCIYFSGLLSLPNFRILRSPYVHSRICPRMYMYIAVYIILAIHCIYTPRVLHFSAFIIKINDSFYKRILKTKKKKKPAIRYTPRHFACSYAAWRFAHTHAASVPGLPVTPLY